MLLTVTLENDHPLNVGVKAYNLLFRFTTYTASFRDLDWLLNHGYLRPDTPNPHYLLTTKGREAYERARTFGYYEPLLPRLTR